MAVSRRRGTSLPTMGPGASARITWMVRPEPVGTSAIISTSTPIPPTQWVKLRQNKMPWLSANTSPRVPKTVRMEAPVVVKPLTVSKKASTKLGMTPLNTKGSAPTAERKIQLRAAITKPSLA